MSELSERAQRQARRWSADSTPISEEEATNNAVDPDMPELEDASPSTDDALTVEVSTPSPSDGSSTPVDSSDSVIRQVVSAVREHIPFFTHTRTPSPFSTPSTPTE